MSTILERLNRRFQLLAEQYEGSNASWKDPNSPHYDRQKAEDALFHTVGPLTENPAWVNDHWTSPGQPVPGFKPGGPAPRWTEYEVVMAMAGDPSLIFKGRDNPRSPEYGNKGGAPVFRMAKKVARIYNRGNSRSDIEDLYGNGLIALTQIMKPGYDAGTEGYIDKETGQRKTTPFILFAKRHIISAMELGVGGNVNVSRAAGEESKATGLRGMKALLQETDPQAVRQAAEVVKGKYREQRSHDKTPDNPFGPFSSAYYQTAMAYADALESEDEDQIEAAQSRMRQLIDEIQDFSIPIRGAATGIGQAISTPDRVKKDKEGNILNPVNIQSMDVNAGNEEGSSMAGNIPTDDAIESWIDPESIKYVLDIAMNYDIGQLVGSSPKYRQVALDFANTYSQLGGSTHKKKAEKVEIGGRLTVQEFRYAIRRLGPIGSNYPGRGRPRERTNIPRDATGWWQPGEDPEIEPIPGGDGIWHSIWSRNGYQVMGSTEIGKEMIEEAREFVKLGIPTKRADMIGKEMLSKVGINNTTAKAMIKIRLISYIHKYELGMEEDIIKKLPILEGMSAIDRMVVAETAEWMANRLATILEVSPPGWKGSVKAMKKHKEIDNPWALAWSMKNKGAKPHYKDDESGEKKKQYADESAMKPVDTLDEFI